MTTSEIVKLLRTTRDEFATLFLQAQGHRPFTDRMQFEAIAPTVVGTEALQRGLDFALANQFLDELLLQIIDQERADPALTSFVLKKSGETNAALQGIVDAAQGFDDPALVAQRLNQGVKWACKIYIDEAVSGTGVLIKPNLVLTAWHVVAGLFKVDPADPLGPKKPDPMAAQRLKVEFDNHYSPPVNGAGPQLSTSVRIAAHTNWWVRWMPCHAVELNKQLPDNLSDLDGFFDFAVIRLARPIGYERRWAPIDANAVVPVAGQPILVFQHPAGSPLKTCTGRVTNPQRPNLAVFPRLRFLHGANTTRGSSGGPCFDKDFQLIGLHQGEWPTPIRRQTINRAVPIMGIRAGLGDLPDPDPADSPVWTLGKTADFAPVLGCDDFQATLWKSVISWKNKANRPPDQVDKQLFVIGNWASNPSRAGSGKTFRTKVLNTMLPPSDHLIINLGPNLVAKQSAAELAITIRQLCGQTPPPIDHQLALDTTTAAILGPDIWAPLLSTLEKAREGRLVWLILTDLNNYHIDGQQTTDLLALIYEQVKTLDWLRIVLDDMQGDLSSELTPYIERIDTPALTRHDIATYFRKWLAERNQMVDDAVIDVLTPGLERTYRNAVLANSPTANSDLIEAVMDASGDIIAVAKRIT